VERLKKFIPKKEFRTYCLGAVGSGMIYGIMSSYISDFYVNVLRVGPLFAFFLMLFARIWNAVNDPMMGAIMDRAEPKKGKMLPYLLYTYFPIAGLTLLLFLAPELSDTAKMVYAAVTYVCWGMVYTISDVPFWSLPNIMTPNPDERGKLISLSRTTNGIGAAVPMAVFMALGMLLPRLTERSGLELEKLKYLIIVFIAAGAGTLFYMRVYFGVKERVHIPKTEKRAAGGVSALKLIFGCKPLVLVLSMSILSAGRYMFQAGAIHVARYTFYIGPDVAGLSGQELEQALQSNISTVSLMFSLATAAGMFLTMILVSSLISRFNYKQIVIFSCIIGSAASFAMYFIGYEHFWVCVPLLLVTGIPLGAINVVAFAMIGDSLDYMEWKTGIRNTGLGNACQSFTLKFGNALATSGIILMYMVVKLDIKSIVGTEQTMNPLLLAPSIRNGMFSLVSLIPAISLLLCMIPIFFYDLTGTKKEQITRELAQQRAEKGIVVE